jgi:hypothetical protein
MQRRSVAVLLGALSLAVCTTPAADTFVPGVLKHEFYAGATSRAQVESGSAGSPSLVEYINTFEIPDQTPDLNNYVRRISGFFVPAATGNYVFFITSDDDSDLFLSTDATPANKRLIAQETVWSNPLEWTISAGASSLTQRRSDQFSPAGSTNKPFASGISLTAGQHYYIEAVHHEGGGGDHVAVTFKTLSDPDPDNGTDSALTGNLIGVLSPSTPIIVTQPLSRRVLPGDIVTFSTAVDPPTATLQWMKNGTAIPGETTSTYTTPAIVAGDNGASYSVSATLNGTTVQSSNAVITVGQLVAVAGAKDEIFNNATRADIEDPGFATPPDQTFVQPAFEGPTNLADNYAQRLSGLFKPAVTGDYVFFIASDDDSDLFISTDSTPANKQQIASETGWSGVRNWTGADGPGALTVDQAKAQKRSDQWVPDPANPPAAPPFANGIHLVAGTSYYLEADHHEGGGGDNLAVTFKLKGEPDPVAGDPSKITTALLAPYAQTLNGATITISGQPTNTTGLQSRTATLGISAISRYLGDASTASPGLSYQWQTAPSGSTTFTNIPGATGTSLTTPLLTLTDAGRQYRVALTAGDTNITSTAATLTVTPDTVTPRPFELLSVDGSLKALTLSFNELVDSASAQTGANYVVGSTAGASAVLDANGSNVTVNFASAIPEGANTLKITGVKDLAGNAIGANSGITFSFSRVTYAANISFDKPVAYFRFEEPTAATTATNSGTSGVEGLYMSDAGGPGPAKGEPGPRPPTFAGFDANNLAASFGGADGMDWVDAQRPYLDHLGAFSLEYWVLTTDRTNQGSRIGIVGQNDAVEYGFIDPNTIQIWTPGGGSLNTPYSFPDNTWHHIATIADGTALKNYYDGVFQNSAGNATTDYGSAAFNVHIGGGGVFDGTGNYFLGRIDECAVFDKAIPAARVLAHYNAGKSGGVLINSSSVFPPDTTGGNTTLSVTRSGNTLSISWTPTGGTLQSVSSLSGTPNWTDIGTANPTSVTIGKTNQFFRVKK